MFRLITEAKKSALAFLDGVSEYLSNQVRKIVWRILCVTTAGASQSE